MKFKLTTSPFLPLERQLLTIMKMFIFLLCTTVFSFNVENIFSQEKVTIHRTEMVKVDRVFKIIKKQTNYDFIYPKELFNNSQKVQLEKGEILVTNLIQLSLSNIDLIYEISPDNVIIIRKKPKDVISNISLIEEIQSIEISGKIKDSDGEPLPGASILEKGTTNGTESDFDGNFSLNVSNTDATLIVSFIGYLPQEVSVAGQEKITIALLEDAASLEEVVIIGYGSQKQTLMTGSVGIVSQEEITKGTYTNSASALQGRVPGVKVESNGGAPGAGVNVVIRGTGSFGKKCIEIVLKIFLLIMVGKNSYKLENL